MKKITGLAISKHYIKANQKKFVHKTIKCQLQNNYRPFTKLEKSFMGQYIVQYSTVYIYSSTPLKENSHLLFWNCIIQVLYGIHYSTDEKKNNDTSFVAIFFGPQLEVSDPSTLKLYSISQWSCSAQVIIVGDVGIEPWDLCPRRHNSMCVQRSKLILQLIELWWFLHQNCVWVVWIRIFTNHALPGSTNIYLEF